MSWSTLHTFAYAEVPTAANLNTNYANLNETSPAKVTTKADMTAATGANALGRVAGGSVRYWSPFTDSAETAGIKFYPAPVQLDYSYASYTVGNTTSETDTWSYALAAGALGAKELMHINFYMYYLNTSGGNLSFTLKFFIGTTQYAMTVGAFSSSATKYPIFADIFIRPLNATNSQEVLAQCRTSGVLGGVGDMYDSNVGGTGSDDFSAAKTLKVSITHSYAHASVTMKVYHPTIIVYPGMT